MHSEISDIIAGTKISLLLEHAVEAVYRNREIGEAYDANHSKIYVNAERLQLTNEENGLLISVGKEQSSTVFYLKN